MVKNDQGLDLQNILGQTYEKTSDLRKSLDDITIYKESYERFKKNLGQTYAKVKINL